MDYKVVFKSFADVATKEAALPKETWEHVLGIYEKAVQTVAGTQARQAIFELADFEEAAANGIGGYTLILQRDREAKTETWVGTFQQGQKLLKVRAALERA